jgi:hypothetical protein
VTAAPADLAAKVGELPVQQPARFEFAISLKTAKVLRTIRAFCA